MGICCNYNLLRWAFIMLECTCFTTVGLHLSPSQVWWCYVSRIRSTIWVFVNNVCEEWLDISCWTLIRAFPPHFRTLNTIISSRSSRFWFDFSTLNTINLSLYRKNICLFVICLIFWYYFWCFTPTWLSQVPRSDIRPCIC